jgi:RecB family endonuclease NucS
VKKDPNRPKKNYFAPSSKVNYTEQSGSHENVQTHENEPDDQVSVAGSSVSRGTHFEEKRLSQMYINGLSENALRVRKRDCGDCLMFFT